MSVNRTKMLRRAPSARVANSPKAANNLGLTLTEVLRTQAAALRERKRLSIVEEGGKGSILMVLPVAVFILPVLFVILLAPAAASVATWGQ